MPRLSRMRTIETENRYQLEGCDHFAACGDRLSRTRGANTARSRETTRVSGLFDYTAAFQSAVDQVKGEGRYRVFADLKRVRGQFPKAVRRLDDGSEQDVVIWCSNDYLGMGAGFLRRGGRLVIPNSAGVGSALGFLWAPVAYQTVRSLAQRLDRIDHAAVDRLLAELTATADDVVLRAAPGAALVRHRQAFMRYAGQGHEIPVELPEGTFDAAASKALHQRFEERYAALYGRSLPHIA
eukprot:gene3412-4650_t